MGESVTMPEDLAAGHPFTQLNLKMCDHQNNKCADEKP